MFATYNIVAPCHYLQHASKGAWTITTMRWQSSNPGTPNGKNTWKSSCSQAPVAVDPGRVLTGAEEKKKEQKRKVCAYERDARMGSLEKNNRMHLRDVNTSR
jgi:hypothetical protein